MPGCLDGWVHACRTLGRLPLAAVVAPAARLARTGAVLDEAQAGLLTLLQDILLLTEEGRAVFAPDGRVLRAGERLRNPRRLARPNQHARARRLSGEIAEAIGAARETLQHSREILARARRSS